MVIIGTYFPDTNVLIFNLTEFETIKHDYSNRLIDNTDKRGAKCIGFIPYTIMSQFESKTNINSMNYAAENIRRLV